jgi:hypothetical protein
MRCSLKNEVEQPPPGITTNRPFGLGTASVISAELGTLNTTVLFPSAGSSRSTLPEQLSGAGSPPATPLRYFGPVLIVSHTGPPGSACGEDTSIPGPAGSLATTPSRRPSRNENRSSAVLCSHAHAGNTEMNDPILELTD